MEVLKVGLAKDFRAFQPFPFFGVRTVLKHLLVALSRCPDATAIVRTTRLAANGTEMIR